MQRFHIVDVFTEISDSLSEMAKSVANEPSLGLFYVQKHVHSAVPNLICLRETVARKSHEITLHTEDLDDSISAMKSMEFYGSRISEEMIKQISDSLSLLSEHKHIPTTRTILQIGTPEIGSSSCSSSGNEKKGYVSSILKRAKLRARNFTWGLVTINDARVTAPSSMAADNSYIVVNSEADELPLSSFSEVDQQGRSQKDGRADFLLETMKYEDFRANRKANLEQWLEETSIGYRTQG